MSDPAATLRALADACDQCHRSAMSPDLDTLDFIDEQRRALWAALPGTAWAESATALRAMADELDGHAKLRAIVEALGGRRSIRVMRLDHIAPDDVALVCGRDVYEALVRAGLGVSND